MWFRIQIGWHIVKGPLQGQPPGLSCGNVGQMRSPNTIQYIYGCMHIPVGVLWMDVHRYPQDKSTSFIKDELLLIQRPFVMNNAAKQGLSTMFQ